MKETNFKQTELGSIPYDWEIKPLWEVAPLQRGFDLPKQDLKKGPYPVVYSNGIGAYHSEYLCEAPGLITGRSGTLGKFILIKRGYYWPHNTTLWVTNFKGNDSLFLYYLYSTLNFEISSTGTGVPTLNRNFLRNKLIPVPPLAEQGAIGKALSDVDELIDGLKKLIEKKRAIKQGALSELLSGKRRLPGFNKPWRRLKLSDLAHYANVILMADTFEDTDYICTENMLSDCKGVTPYSDMVLAFYVKSYVPFDILLSNIRPYLKKLWLSDRSGGVSNDVLVIRPHHELVNSQLLYYILSRDDFFDYNMEGVSGTKMPRGNKTHIMKYEFTVPSDIAEQAAIAAVLTDMDNEIAALEKKLSKYQQIKQGMMAQLLTGKIRLIQEDK